MPDQTAPAHGRPGRDAADAAFPARPARSPGGPPEAACCEVLEARLLLAFAFGGISIDPQGDQPAAIVAADLNGDGVPDLAVANASSNDVSIMFTGAGGTPGAPARLGVGAGPRGIAAGDVDGDGDLDLVVANSLGSTLTLLINAGGGTMVRGADIMVSQGPRAVCIADFTGDGVADLAVAVFGSSRVGLLRGLGGGGFAPPTFTRVGDGPVALAPADVDLDGDLDLAAVGITAGTVTVLRNNGSGTFSEFGVVPVGSVPRGIAAADLDGDGDPDFAVANSFSGTVSVLLNTGGGRLTERGQYAAGEQPYGIVAGDFDRDGRADLATANHFSNDVSVLKGDGHGVLAAPERFSAGAGPMGLTAADFNGDGFTDLAVADSLGDTIRLLRGATPQPNVGPVIGSLVAAPSPAVRGQMLTLTAMDVGDPDGIVTEVRFYRDSNGNGLLDPTDQQLSPIDTTVANGWTWSGTVPAAWGTGAVRFFAQAFDDDGGTSGLAAAEVTLVAPPAIGSLTASPSQVEPGAPLTLTATGVSDADGSVTAVRFYRDSNGNGSLDEADQLLTEDADPDGGFRWSGVADPSWGPGIVRFFARAVDNTGLVGAAQSATVRQSFRPTLAGGSASPDPVLAGRPLTVTATGAADPDGAVVAVSFWVDFNNDGVVTPRPGGPDRFIGEDRNGADGFSVTAVPDFGRFGQVAILAVPEDNVGVLGAPVAIRVTVQSAPVLVSMHSNWPRAGEGETLTLTSVVYDADGPVASVMFYRDSNSSGALDPEDEPLGADTDPAGGFSVSVVVPAGWGPGVNRFFSQAVDADGNFSEIGSKTVLINNLATLTEFSISDDTLLYFQTVFLTAAGASDSDGFVQAVRFYRDVQGNGYVDESDRLIGEVTHGPEGVFDLVTEVHPITDTGAWTTGAFTILAVAVDDLGSEGVPLAQDVFVRGVPFIEGMVVFPHVVRSGSTFQILLQGVRDDDGAVEEVRLYRDSNRNGQLDETDQLLPSTMPLVASPAWERGVQRFFAVAEDNEGLVGPAQTATAIFGLPPVIADFTANPAEVGVGDMVTLSTVGVGDPDPNAVITSVRAYRDLNANGSLDPEERTQFISLTELTSGFWRTTVPAAADWPAQTRLLAVATNDIGMESDPLGLTITVLRAPLITAITPSTAEPFAGGQLTLTVAVDDPAGLTLMRFFRDSNRSGTLDEADEELVPGDADGPPFSWTGTVAESWGTGPATFFAVPFGQGGVMGHAVSQTLSIWSSLYFPEGWRNDTTVNEYVPLVNPHPFPVTYRVLAHYEVGERDQVIASGVLAPRSRGGITVTERGRGGQALTRLNVGYALEVQSSAAIGAVLSRYDNFSPGAAGDDAATGEAFTAATSTLWTFPDVARLPGSTFDFLLYYNPTDVDGSVTFTLYYEDGTVREFTWGAAAKRRGGLNVNAEDLPEGRFAAVVTSTVPLIMADSRYEAQSGQGFTALGGAGPGALVTTLPYVDARASAAGRLVIFNPDPAQTATVRLTVSYHTEPALALIADHQLVVQVPAHRALAVATDELRLEAARRVTVRVEGDLPVAAQFTGVDALRGDATGAGVGAAAKPGWLFADGFLDRNTAGQVGFEELALHNPGDHVATVVVVFYYSDGSEPASYEVTLSPNQSKTIDLHAAGSPALRDELNFYSLGVFADVPVLALMTHWDLFQNGGWSTFGTPLEGPPA